MNIGEKIDRQKLILAGLLIALGVLFRVLLHDFFNNINNPFTTNGYLDVFFVIAAVSIFSGILLGKYYTLIIPICVIGITDVFYAIVDPTTISVWTSWLFLFIGTGYVFIAMIGFYTKRKTKLNKAFIPKLLGAGVVGIVVYDLWTNFGFWLAYSKLGFYPQTLGGLVTVFIGGIPFMLWHLISASLAITIVAIPLVYFREHKILNREFTLKPVEKYVIASATAVLMIASIITAVF